VLVERSPQLRAEQRARLPIEPVDEALGPFVRAADDDRPVPAPGAGPVVTAVEDLPALAASSAVVLANELLDNLPFGVAEWDGERWLEVRVAMPDPGRFAEVRVPFDTDLGWDVPAGTRVPIPRGLVEWWGECEALLHHGFVLAIDYVSTIAQLAERPWLRTYRAHSRGASPLDLPGEQDITADVILEQVDATSPFPRRCTTTQREWLGALGVDALVEEGRARWEAGARDPDLDALAGRSRATEAAALTDPDGLGAHRVMLFGAGGTGRGFTW
jgi:SAM-dependent MidA family methyltransferase